MDLQKLIDDNGLKRQGNTKKYKAKEIKQMTSLYRGIAVTPDAMVKQEYFYRATSIGEAELWLSDDETKYRNAIKSEGHQGLASCFKYADTYVTNRGETPIVLEFYAPEFPEKAIKLGYNALKPESGDLSWGLSKTNSMGYNTARNTVYSKEGESYQITPKISEDFIKRMCQKYSVSYDSSNHKNMANELVGYLFCESILEVRVVEVEKI